MTIRLFIFVAAMALASRAPTEAIDEYQVKAAFVYNFAKFVEWPREAFKTPNDPVLVCVFGHNPFGGALEETIRGKSINGRPLIFRLVNDAEEAASCQILFVGSTEVKRFHATMANLKSPGILTIGEAPGFAAGGGMINFKVEGGHVRFEINVDAAQRGQLHVSSKLLNLADIVKSEKPQ